MLDRTARIWAEQDRHAGDRLRLFGAVAEAIQPTTALYPGSWADVAPSFWIDDVTYVDSDRRAEQFFADSAGVAEIVARHRLPEAVASWRFVAADYRDDLPVDAASVDLLISLYAGLVSEHCTRYLRPGGHLLVNPSHGDAAMASFNDRYDLIAVVWSRGGTYVVDGRELDRYLTPKKPDQAHPDHVRATGRGIAYTRSAFAYLFQLA